MKIPLSITYRHIPPSPAIESVVRERADKLERFSDNIIRCDVAIEAPHRRHQQGNLFQVRINLSVPGQDIVVKQAPDAHPAYEDAYVAIRDAFDAARRQLEDYERKRRGEVKRHSA